MEYKSVYYNDKKKNLQPTGNFPPIEAWNAELPSISSSTSS